MTSSDDAAPADEAERLRAELRSAESRVRMLRKANATLEQKVLRPAAFRRGASAAVLAAVLTTTLAYVGAAHLGDQRAARERELAELAHAQRVADRRMIADACEASLKRTIQDIERCRAERNAFLERARRRWEDPPTRPRGEPRCNCQPGDPLCSCL